MNILYLYAELMGYQMPVFEEYVKTYGATLHVVHWDHKKLTPYSPKPLKQVKYYNRSSLSRSGLVMLAESMKPDVVYVSGWMDKDYLYLCKVLRKKGVPVVAGSDSQWRGGFKQALGIIYFKFFLKKAFSHIWVAGPYQFEYARKLSFSRQEIIFNCLTADTNLFDSNLYESVQRKRNFLFVGRFEKSKGLMELVRAWDRIENKKEWTLTLIGNGSLKERLLLRSNIIIKDFLQPEMLVKEFAASGCFLLPSLAEPWALVIHEAVSMSLPIIATDVCGATPVFITENYNGFVCKAGNINDLKEKMLKIINMSDSELKRMGVNSYTKSKQISPEITSAAFISSLKI